MAHVTARIRSVVTSRFGIEQHVNAKHLMTENSTKTGLAALRHCDRVDIIDEVKHWGEGRILRLLTVMFPIKTREKAAL